MPVSDKKQSLIYYNEEADFAEHPICCFERS